MSEALIQNSTDWQQNYYQHQILDDWEVPFGGISDSFSDSMSFGDNLFPVSDTKLVTSSVSDNKIFIHDSSRTTNGIPVFTPENSSVGLSPKATIAKQGKRRSRAARRAPATLLNASIKNFRELVQQYTGCHSSSSAFKSGNGPITLNFGSSSSVQNEIPPPSFATEFGRGTYYYTGQ